LENQDLFLSIFQKKTLNVLILFLFMWQIFIFIEQKYLDQANILFIQQTKQIFFYRSKKIMVKKSWSQNFMGRVFHGAKFHGIDNGVESVNL